MLEFKYTKRGPLPWAIVRTNLIRLYWREDGALVAERHFGGEVKDNPIVCVFDNGPSIDNERELTPENVARMIHWGCCGWDANLNEVWSIYRKVKPFIEAGIQERTSE